MFESKIERANGLLTVHIKSEALEQMMKSLAQEKTEAVLWQDGLIEGPGVVRAMDQVHRWAVKAAKLTAAAQSSGIDTAWLAELMAGNGRQVSLVPLTLKGLAQGIVIKPNVPYHVDALRAWAKGVADVAHALLTSVQPVLIHVSVRPPASESTSAG